MFDNSFSWFLINMGIGALWLAGAVATHDYFVALGALFFIGVAMLIDLPGIEFRGGFGGRRRQRRVVLGLSTNRDRINE